MLSLPSVQPFPFALVCPSCGAPLAADKACPCPSATRLEMWNGIPRLLFGQRYGGECSAEMMAEILRRMDSAPWRQVLDAVVPNDPVHAILTSLIGPDFVYAMPWDDIKTVLDVGSGMGLMTALLAERAKTVISLEGVPERALFQRKRAVQDGFTNWHPIIAAPTALPFAPETFDLITLNGVFAHLGIWGEGDPEQVQRRFLESALRLLKPNGYLYAGIETRFNLGRLLRRAPGPCGGARPADGRRICTYTPNQYRRMFSKAGFGDVEVYGLFEGYNRQQAIYPLKDAGARRAIRDLVNPPASWKGWAIRKVETAGLLGAAIEKEVVMFARKTGKAGALAWAGLPREGTLTQFSSGDKVFVLCFKDGGPKSVFKGPKTNVAVAWLAKEYEFLQAASHHHGAAADSWPLRWPKPLGTHEVHGRRFYRYEFFNGRLLNLELLPISFDLGRFRTLFSRLVENYIGLCDRLTAVPAGPTEGSCTQLLDSLAAVQIPDEACSKAVARACVRMRSGKWETRLTHGDLSLSNTLLLRDQTMVLLDWESAAHEGLVAIDLIRLLYDVLYESGHLKPGERRAVMECAKRTVREALSRIGVAPDKFDDFEALFVAHQLRFWCLREPLSGASAKARELIRKYHSREASPAD